MKIRYKLFKFLYNRFSSVGLGNIGSKIRIFLLNSLLPRKCSGVYIGKHVTITNPELLEIGNNVSIHDYCYIDSSGKVKIGDNVSIANGCSIISFNHTYKIINIPIRNQPIEYKPIEIGNNCWIGCKVILLAGASIGEHSIIGAGAVVTKTFPKNCIVCGNPARVIKNI